MKRFWLLLVLFSSGNVQAQEPYYELPAQRDLSESLNLPNLDSKRTYFYLALNGGVKLAGLNQSGSEPSRLSGKDNGITAWEAMLGYNYNSEWQAELGFSNYPVFIDLRADLSPYYFTVPIKSGSFYNYGALRGKKRIANLDKVASRTSLFFTFGVLFDPVKRSEKDSKIYDYQILVPTGRNTADTLNFKSEFSERSVPVKFETGLELSGKLSEQFELGIYVRSLLFRKNMLSVNSSFQYDNLPIQNYVLSTNGYSFLIGFQVRYNFYRGIIYKSRI